MHDDEFPIPKRVRQRTAPWIGRAYGCVSLSKKWNPDNDGEGVVCKETIYTAYASDTSFVGYFSDLIESKAVRK